MTNQGQGQGQGQGASSGKTEQNKSQVSVVNQTAADCVDNQYFWYGQCVTIGTECINRTASNKCQGCIRGFELKDGYCIQLAPEVPAATGSGKGSPQSTPSGSAGSNTCNFPCATCAASSPDKCLTCATGYTTVDAFPGLCFVLN